MRNHKKLRAFILANELAVITYQLTAGFPKEEMYGLVAQMRRSAVSIPSNIVEGCARHSTAEYLRFLDISFGSFKELQYQFSLSKQLGFINETEFENVNILLVETEKVLSGLIRSKRAGKRCSNFLDP